MSSQDVSEKVHAFFILFFLRWFNLLVCTSSTAAASSLQHMSELRNRPLHLGGCSVRSPSTPPAELTRCIDSRLRRWSTEDVEA